MTATSRDIETLCRAVDECEDGALPVLADALEEAGDPRAPALRLMLRRYAITDERPAEHHPRPNPAPWGLEPGDWGWEREREDSVSRHDVYQHVLATRLWGRLEGGREERLPLFRVYRSRSAAFLALAEAMGRE